MTSINALIYKIKVSRKCNRATAILLAAYVSVAILMCRYLLETHSPLHTLTCRLDRDVVVATMISDSDGYDLIIIDLQGTLSKSANFPSRESSKTFSLVPVCVFRVFFLFLVILVQAKNEQGRSVTIYGSRRK